MTLKQGIQEIAPGLFQGALAHASTDTVISNFIDVIALMAPIVEPLPPAKELWYHPIDDNANGCNEFDYLYRMASTLKDKRVLTLCHMGENRSGLLSALILVARGVTPQAAVQRVQEHGPVNSSNQTHSFWNPGFVLQVLEMKP